MKPPRRRNPWRWAALLLAVAIIAGLAYLLLADPSLIQAGNTTGSTETSSLPTVEIQSPEVASTATSASGNLALVDERDVPLASGGIVKEIAVKVGDAVRAGQVLLRLDTSELERAVAQAELSVESAQIALADLTEAPTAAELAQAEAAFVEAQENLQDVLAGPSETEVAAAQSSLAAASASYNELVAGPSEAELTQLSATLRKAEIALADAQRAYDQVAWQASASASSQAVALQDATIDYESAKAAFEESTAAASDSSLQSAASSIQNAQASLDTLLSSPTAAEIATAEAQVADAEAALNSLQAGPTANELRSAEITLEKALIELESAQRDLDGAVLAAPVDGVVTVVNATVGNRSSADTVVVTLTDPTQLELVINVAEADIPNVSVGQQASVEIDAFPGETFAGYVESIAPVSSSSSTAVSYPVTIRLEGNQIAGVLPGMNAVATLASTKEIPENSWLVPTNAVQDGDGGSKVTVVRSGLTFGVTVTTSGVQGEWTIVQSPELQAGDLVVGTLTTSLDDTMGFPGMGANPGGGMGGAMPMGGGGPPPQ